MRFCTCSTIFFLDLLALAPLRCPCVELLRGRGSTVLCLFSFYWCKETSRRALLGCCCTVLGCIVLLFMKCSWLGSFLIWFSVFDSSCTIIRIKCLLQSIWAVLGFICASFNEMFPLVLFSYLISFIWFFLHCNIFTKKTGDYIIYFQQSLSGWVLCAIR